MLPCSICFKSGLGSFVDGKVWPSPLGNRVVRILALMSSSLPVLFVVELRERVAARLASLLAKLRQPVKVQDGGLLAYGLLGLLAVGMVDLGWLLLDHHHPGDSVEGCFCLVSFEFGSD